MALPTLYDEPSLGAYMLRVLGPTAAVLGWTGQSAVQDAIDDSLAAYGVTDISLADDILKLRTFARWAAWRLAVDALPMQMDVSLASGDSFKRSQLYAQAVMRLQAAEADAERYGLGPEITILRVERHRHYRWYWSPWQSAFGWPE